jgi:Ice-binding-like
VTYTVTVTVAAAVAVGPNLGLAAPFASAAKSGLMNVGATTINGNVLLDPNQTCNSAALTASGDFTNCGGTAPTLGGTSKVISTLYTGGSNITTIKSDLNAAYLSITPLAGPPAVGSLGGGITLATTTIGGVRGAALVQGVNLFAPGIYKSGSTLDVTGDITLDAGGNANALFYFQAGSALTIVAGGTTPSNTRILLAGGAKASNVWWQVGSSATIGTYAEFQGNVLAAVDVTMQTGATACGRLLGGAWGGSSLGVATFGANIVSVPGQTFAPPSGYSTICQ